MPIHATAQSLADNSMIPLTDCCASSQRELCSQLAAEGEAGDEEAVWVSVAVVAAVMGAVARRLCATAPL